MSQDNSISSTTNIRVDRTRLYSNFNTIPTSAITEVATSDVFELDHNSTGPTYVCVVYGAVYTAVMTPYTAVTLPENATKDQIKEYLAQLELSE